MTNTNPQNPTTHVKIPSELYAKALLRAAQERRSLGSLLVLALAAYLGEKVAS